MNLSMLSEKILLQRSKQQKLESRKEQNKSRDEKESKREQKKQSNILGSAAKLAVKPFTGILDRLKKFAMFTFAGFLADKVIKFFTDPENVKKREAMLDFLEDHGLRYLLVLFYS